MVEKRYEWAGGAELQEHSRRKHKIIKEYIFDYLVVRCKAPRRERFRLAIVDGFAGGGQYQCGSPGSPLIFIEELRHAVDEINIHRATQYLKAVDVECLLILNDADPAAIEQLKLSVNAAIADIKDTCPRLHLNIEYFSGYFENMYPEFKAAIKRNRYNNVIFNLDQCGHSHVYRETIRDIMRSYKSVEIFYTFVIGALLAFLKKSEPDRLRSQLNYLGISENEISNLDKLASRNEWLGIAEKIVFDTFQGCAHYVSPFSINNPEGWRYWLIHLANSYRGRQVYNNILHENATLQAHFGRSGLNMLSYDPRHEGGMLYLFNDNGRIAAKNQLMDDIPRLILGSKDGMSVQGLYESIYNATPAHADDIHAALIENSDLAVVTKAGGERRKSNSIETDDTIKVRNQRSFFPHLFFKNPSGKTDKT